MIPKIKINQHNSLQKFKDYDISEEDEERYKALLQEGKTEEVMSDFLLNHLNPAMMEYELVARDYLSESMTGMLEDPEASKMKTALSLLGASLSVFIISNYTRFVNNSYLEGILKQNKIESELIKDKVRKMTIEAFELTFKKAIFQSQSFLTNSLRRIQLDLSRQNPDTFNHADFKRLIKARYPQIYKAVTQGNIITTRSIIDGKTVVRHFKPDYYIDLITRTNTLNIDRNTAVVAAVVYDEPIVEFYLADSRNVKKDRELCEKILATKILGKSLLATNEASSSKYHIMSVQQARETPDYTFGPMCRHSVRRVGEAYMKHFRAFKGEMKYDDNSRND